MKKILISLLLLPLFSIGQEYTDFLPKVAWRTLVDSVVFQNTDTFTVKVNPLDLSDQGAFEKTVGNFLIDNKARKYKIIDNTQISNGIILTVEDVFKSGAAPYQGLVGYVIESPNGAFASGLSTYFGEKLDPTTEDYEKAIDLRIAYEKGQTIPFDSMRMDTNYIETDTEPKGTMYWDDPHRTYTINLGHGVKLQLGQESHVHVYNGTADTLKNQRIIGFGGVSNDRISAVYASKDERHTFFGATTEDIAPGDSGLAVNLYGAIHGAYTGSLVAGLPFYLDSMGYITNDRPSFPDYVYPLGTVTKEGAGDGIIFFRSDGINFRSSIIDAFDGAIRETFDFRTFSDGINVYGVLSNPTGSDKLTLMFSDGWWDYSVPDTITLITGTATNPQQSWVYIDKETRTLQSSISGFPSTEHAEIAKITLLDVANTNTYGALKNQNTNNHLKYTDNNGHIVHLGDRLRVINAQWEDGVALTVSGTPTNLYLATTSGHVWQLHKQSFEAQNMTGGDDVHVPNHPTTAYFTTTNLNAITTYSTGSTWNNQWQNLVVWGVANKTGEISHLMVNLASDGYLSESDAIADRNNYTNYTIPREFRGVGFLIARITVRRDPTGYTFNSGTGYLDLRGYYPNNTAGGGTGSSGITEFTQLDDTPSSYIGQAYKFVRVDSGETALEFVDGNQILLTDFDSTGFRIYSNQISDFDAEVSNNTSVLANTAKVSANNSTITLQRNGVSIGDFTLNQATPETFNFIDNNTTYSAGTGLTLSGTTFNHTNSITAGSLGDAGTSRTLAVGGTFTVPYTTYDAQGHITGNTNKTLTLPSTYTPSAHTLDSHSNMAIISNTTGEILQWNGSVWLNRTLAEAGVQPTLSLTTTGNSGAASLIGNTLNIPQYTLGGLGYTVPSLQQVLTAGNTSTLAITANRFISIVATGTQPYATTSTTLNTNLNADLLDGYHETQFTRRGLLYFSGSWETAVNDLNRSATGVFTYAITGMPQAAYWSFDYVEFDNNTAHVYAVPTSATGDLYYNSRGSATWGNWRKLWHSDNANKSTVNWSVANPTSSYHAVNLLSLQNASLWADLDYLEINGTERISSGGDFTGKLGVFSGTVSWGTPSSDANGKLSYGGTNITMEASEKTQNTNILLRPSGTGKLYYNSRADNISREIYHSGNSNLSSIPWTASLFTVSGNNNSTNWYDAWNNKITGVSVSGTTTKTITLNQQDGGTVTTNFTDLQGVTSVGLSAPTGFTVSSSPITSSGTLALGFTNGYSLPTTANQTNWTSAYNSNVVSAAVTGTTTKTITFTKRDATTFSTNFTDLTGTSLWTDNSSSNYVTPATAGRGIRLGDGISSIYMKSDYPTSAGLGYLGMNYDGINQDFIQFDYLNGDIDIKGDVFMPDINGKTSETKVLYYNETTKEVTQGDLATATEATYTTLGVASFDSTDFEVYNGHVSDRYNKRLPNESFTAVGTTQDIGVFYSPGFEMYAKVSIAVTDVTSSDMSVYTAYVQAFFDNLTNSFNQSSVYPAHSYTNGAAITLVWVDYGNIGQLDCQLSGLVPDHEYNYSIKIEYFRNVTN